MGVVVVGVVGVVGVGVGVGDEVLVFSNCMGVGVGKGRAGYGADIVAVQGWYVLYFDLAHKHNTRMCTRSH